MKTNKKTKTNRYLVLLYNGSIWLLDYPKLKKKKKKKKKKK